MEGFVIGWGDDEKTETDNHSWDSRWEGCFPHLSEKKKGYVSKSGGKGGSSPLRLQDRVYESSNESKRGSLKE